MKKYDRIELYTTFFMRNYKKGEKEHWHFATMINKQGKAIFKYKLYSFSKPVEEIIEKLKIFGFKFDKNQFVIDIDEKIFEENKHLIIANELGLL